MERRRFGKEFSNTVHQSDLQLIEASDCLLVRGKLVALHSVYFHLATIIHKEQLVKLIIELLLHL